MSQFTKIGNAFFRQDDSGQLTAVTDPETMKGLKSGQLGYTAVENTRGLKFAASPELKEMSINQANQTGANQRDGLTFGTPPPEMSAPTIPTPSGGVSSDAPVDLQTLLKAKLTEALTNYKGVSNIAELEARRQEILRKQLLSAPYSEEGDKVMTGAQKLALMRERGKEWEPILSGLEKEITAANEGSQKEMERLNMLTTIGEKLGVFTTPKDEVEMAYKRAQIAQINEAIKTEEWQRKYIASQIEKIEADIASSTPDVASQKTEALTNYALVNDIINNEDLSQVLGYSRFTTGQLPKYQIIENQVKQLEGILKLENRQKLKGSGSISDFEFKILGQAATALGQNLAVEDYLKEAKKVQATFAHAAGMSVPVKITDPKTGESAVRQSDRAGVDAAIADGMEVEYYFE